MRLLLLLPVLLLVAACAQESLPEAEVSLESYFCSQADCARVLQEHFGAGSVNCSFYSLDIPSLIEALEQQRAAVVADDHDRELEDNLSRVRFDDTGQLMHNKFCVGEDMVVTGSFNPTVAGREDHNNLVVINSSRVATNYQDEFAELWRGQFGGGARVRYPRVSDGNVTVLTSFCPEDHCKGHVMRELLAAKRSVRFMLFSFTDRDIARLLVQKMQQGLVVEGLLEGQRTGMEHNVYRLLQKHGVPVTAYNGSVMLHHKVFVIDNETVITGSYNPTQSGAHRNDENLLVIRSSRLAERFLAEFARLHSDMG